LELFDLLPAEKKIQNQSEGYIYFIPCVCKRGCKIISHLLDISISTVSDHIVKATKSVRAYMYDHESLLLLIGILATQVKGQTLSQFKSPPAYLPGII